jgi:hypothetical protein
MIQDSVGYHPFHTNDLATKAYPCTGNQEHKQEQETNILDYEVESHKPMNGDTVRWQIESKQNPQTLKWRWLLNKKELGACKSVAEPTWIIPAQVRESTPEGSNMLQTV